MYYRHNIISSEESLPLEASIVSLDGSGNYLLAEDLTILWVIKGKLDLQLYDYKEIIQEGELYIINEGMLYRLSSQAKSSVIKIKFKKEYYKNLYAEHNDFFFYIEADKSDDISYIKHLISKLIYSYENHYDVYKEYLIDDLDNLIKYIFENNSLMGDTNRKKDRKKERISRIVSYIDCNYNKDIKLGNLAKVENLSTSHLSKLIKDFFGTPFQNYMNEYRLNKFIEKLILDDDSIQDISKAVGFSSSNYMNRVFKERFYCSPRQYRKNFNSSLILEDRAIVMEEIKKNTCVNLDFLEEIPRSLEGEKSISIDRNKKIKNLNKYWAEVLNIESTSLLLYRSIQDNIKRTQEDIGFKYAKFKINIDSYKCINGKIQSINIGEIYEIIDFLLGIELRPFIVVVYDSNLVSLVSNDFLDMELANLDNLMRKLINRYGIEEIRFWRFEFSNRNYRFIDLLSDENMEVIQSEYGLFWNIVKSIDREIKIGLPLIYKEEYFSLSLVEDFIKFLEKSYRTLDFLSLYVFIEDDNDYDLPFGILDYIDRQESFYKKFSDNYIHLKGLFSKEAFSNVEFYIKEYKGEQLAEVEDVFTIDEFDLEKIRKNLLLDEYDLGSLSGIDFMNEGSLVPIIGGGALMTSSGLRKFNYNLYCLLAKLGEELVEVGDDYIVTKTKDSTQVLIYNYRDHDCICLKRQENRSDSYNKKLGLKSVELSIANLSGKYEVREYSLSREDGSAYYNWLKMGSPKALKREEINYLSGRSMPKMEVRQLKIKEGDYFRDTYLIPPYSLKFINMDKIF